MSDAPEKRVALSPKDKEEDQQYFTAFDELVVLVQDLATDLNNAEARIDTLYQSWVLRDLKAAANDATLARDAACVAYGLTRDACDAAYNARNIVIIAARDADAAYEAELKKQEEKIE